MILSSFISKKGMNDQILQLTTHYTTKFFYYTLKHINGHSLIGPNVWKELMCVKVWLDAFFLGRDIIGHVIDQKGGSKYL